MSKYFSLANGTRRTSKNTSLSYALSLPHTHMFLLAATLAMCAAFLIVVVGGMHTTTSTGYQLKELSVQAQKLQEEQETLTVALSQAQSIAVISERVKSLPFQKITSVEYLATEGRALAYGEDARAR